MSGAQNVADPFSPTARRSPRKSEAANAEAAQLEQEEELKRQAEKKAILERRAARRKSLANRRVSFAPEATLHTWSVMELGEDSTTSSASNSTRRQSSMTTQQLPKVVTVPSTPADQTEAPLPKASPAPQRDLHQQKRRRRSSGLPEVMLDASQNEVFSSSPSGDVTTDSSPLRVEEGIESSDESDTDGDTAMSMDDATANTITSQDSGSSTHSSLEERLRQAANQAGTRGIDYDERSDDMSMEMATGTVTHAFQPWARNRDESHENSALYDQENVYTSREEPQSPNTRPGRDAEIEDDQYEQTMEMSMDVTKAVGGIVSRQSPGGKAPRSPASRRRSSIRRRRSSADESTYDETMEFTVMQGGIINAETESNNTRTSEDDMTMEFTHAIGGVLGHENRRESLLSQQTEGSETMDMTFAAGGVLEPIEEQTEPQTDVEEQTVAMDMTRAVGSILNQTSPATKRMTRQSVGYDPTSPRARHAGQPNPNSTPQSSRHLASIASETGSPSLALKPRHSGRSQGSATRVSTTPQSRQQTSTPLKSPPRPQAGTPSKQITPLVSRAETPNKTPLSANVIHRGASPRKLFKAEIKARASPASTKKEATLTSNTLFSRNEETGQQTPRVILRAPKTQLNRRKSSGVGIDRIGIGSPRVSEILDRRASIGDATPEFKLCGIEPGRLRFEDPEQLEHEIEAERADENRRESGRFIMEREADERQEENATLQLKDMIETMSPKKPKPGKAKARKSLAVGGAKGLLGKRPAELDMDDEDDVDTTPKRLKVVSREGSPIKKVHLPKPPSKNETTGRLTTHMDKPSWEIGGFNVITPTIETFSPTKNPVVGSPSASGRYKDVDPHGEARPTSFEEKLDNVVGAIDISTARMEDGLDEGEQEKISLQQFLNMTNIHFIELSTTKRRHTMAQSMPLRESQEGVEAPNTEANFVAAATTLPLLELYQHATRELKSYISTGRKIIRSIEAETLAEQPALFREYVNARPDVKLVMDNQFRNGKANARLQSREGWYEWRGQLVEGLKCGLQGINQDMAADLGLLRQQQQVLDKVVPRLIEEHSELQDQETSLRRSLEEMDSVDREALTACRKQLQVADDHYSHRSALLESLQQEIKEKDDAVLAAAELKTEIQEQITEADRVREEYKGWRPADVLTMKSRAESIEKRTGWRLMTAEEEADETNSFGAALVMMYKDVLRLFFYPQAFQSKTADSRRRRSGRKSASVSGPSAPISLTFAPIQEEPEATPPELPTEKRFFLQMIRSQLHTFTMMPQGSITTKTLLTTVSRGWDLACKVSTELHLLNLVGITTASILSDEKLGVKVMLILPGQGRVDIDFAVSVTVVGNDGFIPSTTVTASAVYGTCMELLGGGKIQKIQNALGKEVGSRALGEGGWVKAVHGFQEWICNQEKAKEEKPEDGLASKAALAKAPPTVTAAPRPEPEPPSEPAPAPSSPSASAPAATAATRSPLAPRRSPLAPKRAFGVQKKALPVPKQRLEKANLQQPQQLALGKENFNPSLSVSSNGQRGPDDMNDWQKESFKSAIPPEMQEAMMHTPIKRVGALRRSPM